MLMLILSVVLMLIAVAFLIFVLLTFAPDFLRSVLNAPLRAWYSLQIAYCRWRMRRDPLWGMEEEEIDEV